MVDLAIPTLLLRQAGFLFATPPVIINNATNELYAVGDPQEAPEYSEGISDEIITFVKDGVTSPAGIRRTGQEPIFQFPALYNPASVALARGREMVTGAVNIPMRVGPFLIEDTVMDLGGVNVDGVDIPDDLANGRGFFESATRDVTESTDRIPFAGTPAAPDQWAQGAARVFKFHPDNVGQQFTWYTPNRGMQNVTEATEIPISSVSIYQEYIFAQGRILVLDAPTAEPRPGAGPLISGNPVIDRFLFIRNPAICTIGPRIYFKDAQHLYLPLC